jgi:nitrate reductase gamma subunit
MKFVFGFIAIITLVVIGWIISIFLSLHYFFLVIIPYIAILIFISGLIYRILKWASAPVPFHIPTITGQQKSLPWIKHDNVESPSTTRWLVLRMTYEIVFFRSLFRNDKAQLSKGKRLEFQDKRMLWLGALAFHWSLFVILFRHLRLALNPVPGVIIFVQSVDGVFQQPWPLFYMTDILILLSLGYLFLRRVLIQQVRFISLFGDYFAVLLVFSIALSGFLMKVFFKVDLESIKNFVTGIISFHPTIPETMPAIFYIHILLVSALLIYFPNGKLVHMIGIFFSPTRNLMNNSRARRHVNPLNKILKVHTYEEYENEFRNVMKDANIPVEKE